MAKYHGAIGFATSVEEQNDVWVERIVEKKYKGDLTRTSSTADASDSVVSDIRISNEFSIVSDQFAEEHFYAIRYLTYAGVRWAVTSVELKRPRLIIRTGGVYNGPTPTVG